MVLIDEKEYERANDENPIHEDHRFIHIGNRRPLQDHHAQPQSGRMEQKPGKDQRDPDRPGQRIVCFRDQYKESQQIKDPGKKERFQVLIKQLHLDLGFEFTARQSEAVKVKTS